MTEYEFQLYYQLPDRQPDPEAWLDALYEAGCDDALVGVAVRGHLSLDFTREAENPLMALRSAMADVRRAIPDAHLVGAGPDLLNLSELSSLLSSRLAPVTRQAMRKYAAGEVRKVVSRFPSPRVNGTTPLWHLDAVLVWLKDNGKITADRQPRADSLIALCETIRAFNAAGEYALSRASHPSLAAQAMKLMEP